MVSRALLKACRAAACGCRGSSTITCCGSSTITCCGCRGSSTITCCGCRDSGTITCCGCRGSSTITCPSVYALRTSSLDDNLCDSWTNSSGAEYQSSSSDDDMPPLGDAVSANQWTDWNGGGLKPEVEVKPEVGVKSIKSPDSTKGSALPRIRAALSARGKKIVWMEDKGDCLFLACSRAIWGDTGMHQTLRQHSVDELKTHSDTYSPFMEEDVPFEAHCARMRRQRQWGGMVQLQAIAE